MPEHLVLGRGQLLLPLLVGLRHFGAHRSLSGSMLTRQHGPARACSPAPPAFDAVVTRFRTWGSPRNKWAPMLHPDPLLNCCRPVFRARRTMRAPQETVDEYEVLVIGSGPVVRRPLSWRRMLGSSCRYHRACRHHRPARASTRPRSRPRRCAVQRRTSRPCAIASTMVTSDRVKEDITVEPVGSKTWPVVAKDNDVVRDELARDVYRNFLIGMAWFDDPDTVAVMSVNREAGACASTRRSSPFPLAPAASRRRPPMAHCRRL